MEWTPDKLTQVATGYWQSALLVGAVQLGLFDHLDDERTAETLAERCGARPEILPAILDALVSIDLLAKRDSFYRIAPGARQLLSRSSPTCMLDALRYNGDLYQQWGKLAEVARTGEPAVAQQKQLGLDPAMTRRFVHAMESKARAFVPAVAPLIQLNGDKTLLDVGSGPGTLSRTIAERKPHLTVTLLDLPDVLNVAKEICQHSPASERLRYFPANYRKDTFPGTHDAVLYAGALHQETTESAQQLAQRFFDALNPGGQVFVVDLMLDDDRAAPTFSALFQITMMLMRPCARVFSGSEVESVLRRVGFERIEHHQPDSSPYRVVSARKPETHRSPETK